MRALGKTPRIKELAKKMRKWHRIFTFTDGYSPIHEISSGVIPFPRSAMLFSSNLSVMTDEEETTRPPKNDSRLMLMLHKTF